MAKNKRFKAKGRFSTSITVNGELVWQDWQKDDERDITADVAELLQREVPGLLVEVKKSQPKVETKAGPTEKAETRQVTDAPKRTRKTKGKS